jgi:hypothetical protein
MRLRKQKRTRKFWKLGVEVKTKKTRKFRRGKCQNYHSYHRKKKQQFYKIANEIYCAKLSDYCLWNDKIQENRSGNLIKYSFNMPTNVPVI